jgi:thymidine kinase
MVNLQNYESGYIEVICGPMFAGKTEELIRRIKRLEIANEKYLVFKPLIDNRYSTDPELVSHNYTKANCICVSHSSEIEEHIDSSVDVIIIDEAQFFDNDIVKLCDKLADDGKRVIVAGLDRDFKGDPFGPMPSLLAIAEFVTKLTAICSITKHIATRTQRLIDGKPAGYDEPIIKVGAKESYEPRSRSQHIVPKKN